ALVHGPRRLGRSVARDPTREAELPEEALHACLGLRHVRVDLTVGPFEPGVGDPAWTTVTGAGDIDHVEFARLDHAIEVHVDEIEAGGCPPKSQQSWLDVPKF